MPEGSPVLLKALEKLKGFAAKGGNTFAVTLLEESILKMRKESFTLVIMGEFKRGKSTFINALLGTDLVPTGIVPLTAIPTIIQYSPERTAQVTYESGEKKTIPPDEVTLYVTEKENPRNKKQVKEVHVSYPAELLRQGVILVDTPGVGSVYQHNTDAAYAYLPHSDVAVFLISVDAPVGQSELAFLGDIRTHVHKLVFVLNKIDILAPGQLEELLSFTQGVLTETLDSEDIQVFPLSARQALEARTNGNRDLLESSRFTDFEQRVFEMISTGKARLVKEITSARALRVISELEMELALWHKAMEGSLEDIKKKVARFEKELTTLEREREDSIYLLYRDIDGLGHQAEERLREFRKHLLPIIISQYRNYAHGVHGTPREIGRDLKEKAHELIEIALAEHRVLLLIGGWLAATVSGFAGFGGGLSCCFRFSSLQSVPKPLCRSLLWLS
ncbi:MAG: dynamin family protein [Bacillota bacterium]